MTIKLLALFAAAAAVSGSAHAAEPQGPGELKPFRDWVAGCDNVKDCEAQALVPDGSEEKGVVISVARAAGPGSQASLSIALRDENRPIALVIDGKRLPYPLRVRDGEVSFGPIGTPALLPDLLKGGRLELIDARGVVIGVASLAGISAALRYVDEQQERGGTVTALIAKGTKPPTAVPARAAPPGIAVPAADRTVPADQLAPADLIKLRAQAGCERTDSAADGESWHRIDRQLTLLLLSCGAGAYNSASAAYLVNSSGGKRPRLAVRVAPFDGDPEGERSKDGAPLLTNAGWDAKAGELSSRYKGRGLGDCGASIRAVWDGARFRLIERRTMTECRGSANWIRVWVAEARKPAG